MKHLNLTDLAKAIAADSGCSLENAVRFVDAQDQYFDRTGVNVKSDDSTAASKEPVIISDEEMMKYIIEYTGMSESFARKLADAERAYMQKNGFISETGEVETFMKSRG